MNELPTGETPWRRPSGLTRSKPRSRAWAPADPRDPRALGLAGR